MYFIIRHSPYLQAIKIACNELPLPISIRHLVEKLFGAVLLFEAYEHESVGQHMPGKERLWKYSMREISTSLTSRPLFTIVCCTYSTVQFKR